MTMRSLAASKPVMLICVARPSTETLPLSPTTSTTSSPFVALMMMVSAAPSPTPPGRPRLMFTSVTSVPDMSLTVILSAPPKALKSINSMSLRSMTTFATSRKKVAWSPFAEMVICSAALEPLNSILSKPSWPSRVSLSSPGFQTKVSSPAPIRAVSLPSPPLMRSSPSLPMRRSLPRPPFIVSWMPSASRLEALITSSPPCPFTTSRSLACSGKKMLTPAWRPNTEMPPESPATPITSAPCVPLTVTVSAAPSPPPFGPRRSMSTRSTSVPLRSPTVTLSAPPRARYSMRSTSSSPW